MIGRRALLAGLALLLARPAAAWPDRAIQLIVPFPAGGIVDVVARSYAQVLSERLGVAVAVVNRDGASGAIGARALATARPDGTTLGFFTAGAITTQPLLVRGVGYSVASFQPICRVFTGGYVLAAAPGAPADAAALLARARREPGAVTLGYGGNGTPPHWILLGLQRAAGLQFNAVPFRGDPPVVTALLGGELAFGVLGAGSAAAAGLPVLLGFGAERTADMPAVPTAREMGLAVEEAVFGGLLAPAGLPPAARQRLEAECPAVAADARLVETLGRMRLERAPADADAFAAALGADATAKRELARGAGLLVE